MAARPQNAPRPGSIVRQLRRHLASGASQAGAWTARHPLLRGARAAWGRLLDEACDLVAPALGRLAQERRIVAVPRPDKGFDLYRVTRGGAAPMEMPAAEAERTRGTVELRLRADQLMERELTLPAASRDYLPTIIDHRLDRLTPWRRERVLHGFAVTGEADGGATLVVRVLIASAEVVDGLIATLRAHGLEPSAIGSAAEQPAAPIPIRLGRGQAVVRRPAWHGRFGRIWLAGTAVLCGLALTSLVWASAAADRRAEAERHLVKARKLIREAADGSAATGDAALLGNKRPETATVVLIDKLATILPDTTYLRELALTPQEVRLAGTSADAPALIPLLEKAGFFDVRFTAPVARGDDRKDSFEITADREPPQPEAQ